MAGYRKFRIGLKRIDRRYEDTFTLNNYKKVKDELRSLLPPDRYEMVESLLAKFYNGFYELWKEKKVSLEKIKSTLESKTKAYREKILLLERMFEPPAEKVCVYVCWNPVETKATPFGASGILIESNLKEKNLFPIMLHELVHLMDMKTGNSTEFFRKIYNEEGALLVTEAMANLFAPNGILIKSGFAGKSEWDKEVGRIKDKLEPAFLQFVKNRGHIYRDFIYKIPDYLGEGIQFPQLSQGGPQREPNPRDL